MSVQQAGGTLRLVTTGSDDPAASGAGMRSETRTASERYALKRRLRSSKETRAGRPEVWLARDRRLGCDVVLKRFEAASMQAYERELSLLTWSLPRLPHLIDGFVEADGQTACIARAFVPGSPLEGLKSISVERAIKIASQVAQIVHGLHTAKTHALALGEVRPDRFISDVDGAIWLISVENAEPLTPGSDQIAKDIEAVGMLALRLLAGDGFDEDSDQALRDMPPAVAKVIARAIEESPEKRYASAHWLAQAFDGLLSASDGDFAGPSQDSAVPRLPKAFFRPVRLDESPVAHALKAVESSNGLEAARLAAKSLSLSAEVSSAAGLRALDTLDVDCYRHQTDAALAVVTNAGMNGGAILADEVGLGKTIEALMVCQELRARGQAESVLIVASPAGSAQWLAETRLRIRRNALERGFRLYQSSKDAGYPLLIVSSATMRQERRLTQLMARSYDLVIVDEAHQCCSGNGQLSNLGKAISRLQRKRLLLLTATPLNHKLWDLYTLGGLIRPGLLGSAKQFEQEFIPLAGDSKEAKQAVAIRSLRARAETILIRHRRAALREVVTPQVECATIATDAPTVAAKVSAAADMICGRWSAERVVVFARAAGLRQALAKEIERREPDRIVLLFQSNRRESKIYEGRFNDYPGAVMLAGDTVAEGMNWQRARCMLNLDAPLTPLVWEQRVGRIYRLGQSAEKLEVAHVIASGTDEERVFRLFTEDLGLFTLPIGEAAAALDHLADAKDRTLESPIRAILRGAATPTQIAVLSAALRGARESYDRQAAEFSLLDDLYFGPEGLAG